MATLCKLNCGLRNGLGGETIERVEIATGCGCADRGTIWLKPITFCAENAGA